MAEYYDGAKFFTESNGLELVYESVKWKQDLIEVLIIVAVPSGRA